MIKLEDMDYKIVTKYIINEKERTIVCIITTVNDMLDRLAKYGLADDDYESMAYDIREYKGIAKCSPEDEWDESYGMKLAEYRAARARQVDINNEIKKYIKGITKCTDNLYKYGMLKMPHYPEFKGDK